MPTASTSQIMGYNECIEPFTSNIYSRGTLAGQFLVINKYLQDDLIRLKLWNSNLKDSIILDNGSVSKITDLPKIIKSTYKIAWDLSMKSLIDQAADRGAYVCQSQSLKHGFKILMLVSFLRCISTHGKGSQNRYLLSQKTRCYQSTNL